MIDIEAVRPWIGLNQCLTPRQTLLLLEHFESAHAAWTASKEALASIPGFAADVESFLQRRNRAPVERELDALLRLELQPLTLADPQYPPALRQVKAPPPLLYVQGEYQARDQLALAVVGTRRASAYGRRAAELLARALAGLLQKGAKRTPAPASLSDEQRRVLDALDFEPTHINALIERLNVGAAQVSAALVELEMLGLAGETEGKHYVKLP